MPGLWEMLDSVAMALANLRPVPNTVRAAVEHTGPASFAVGTALSFGGAGPPLGEAVTVPLETFSKHSCMFGASGCGKTTTGHRLRDAFVGAGMTVIDLDYRGDAFDRALKRLAAAGVGPEKITLIDLRRRDRITPLNFLGYGPGSAESRASVVFGAIRESVTELGVQVAMDLRMAVAVSAESRGSLLDVSRILLPEGGELRERAIAETADDYVRESVAAYHRLSAEMQRGREAACRNKVDAFLIEPTLRASLALPGAPDMAKIMDEPGHVTLIALGADRNPSAAFCGRMMVSAVRRAAMARVDVDEGLRNPVRLLCDEAQNVLGEESCQILAEGRRFRLGIVVMCQFASQLMPELRASVRVNCATQLQFQTSASEAGEFAGEVVSDLPRDEVKRTIQAAPVGSAVVLRRGAPAAYVVTPDAPDPRVDRDLVESLRERATARTTVPKAEVEAFFMRRRDQQTQAKKEVVTDVRKPFRR